MMGWRRILAATTTFQCYLCYERAASDIMAIHMNNAYYAWLFELMVLSLLFWICSEIVDVCCSKREEYEADKKGK